MEASSTKGCTDVYSVIEGVFIQKTIQILISKLHLEKEKLYFKIKKYMIRANEYIGNKHSENQYKMTSWMLEGKKASNGDWIIIDKRSDVSFAKLEVKTFDVECNERLKTVRLTKIDTNEKGTDYYYLCINRFDIFGTLYK